MCLEPILKRPQFSTKHPPCLIIATLPSINLQQPPPLRLAHNLEAKATETNHLGNGLAHEREVPRGLKLIQITGQVNESAKS